jgi:gluconate 2-dehydrogenase gamma chain
MHEPALGSTSRRVFLRRTIAIAPISALAASACTQATPNLAASGPTPAKDYQPSYFHAEEWLFIKAATARLIPSDDVGPGAIEAGAPEFIDRQMDAVFGHAAIWYMQGPFVPSKPEFGYQGKLAPREVYRLGIAELDGHCKGTFGGKTFAQLPPEQQDTVLKGVESGEIAFGAVSSKTFFSFLLQNTKEGYLSDPIHGGNKNAAAWAMIGFPGARADYADWVGRPGEHYPHQTLGPVSINGPQG